MDEKITLDAIRMVVREEVSQSESRLRDEFTSELRSEVRSSEERLKKLMMSGFDTVFKQFDAFEHRFEVIEHVIRT